MNVDAIVFSAQKAANFGVFIWDAQGLVIAALCKKIKALLGLLRLKRRLLRMACNLPKKWVYRSLLWRVIFLL